MVSNESSPDSPSSKVSAKIVVAGGFGVGKTTLVGSVSEIPPVATEAVMTEASVATDNLKSTPDKKTTTVAMDFGRITLDDELILYLFGTTGQARFWFMWDDLVRGALGAIVIVDTRRLADCFEAIDYFEKRRRLPFVIGINTFDGVLEHDVDDIREALEVGPDVPVLPFDARDQKSAGGVLIEVMRHTLRFDRGAQLIS